MGTIQSVGESISATGGVFDKTAGLMTSKGMITLVAVSKGTEGFKKGRKKRKKIKKTGRR